jgi:hypothetical protein
MERELNQMETHPQRTDQAAAPPQAVILQMAMSAMVSQALGVAARLGIPDVLKDGAKSTAEIALATGTHERSIYRILRALASTGVFSEITEKRFQNTPLSEVLRADVPGSMQSMIAFLGEQWHFAVWGNMLHSAKTGEVAFEKTLGDPIFAWFAKHEPESELFNKAMTDMSSFAAPGIVQSYDFSGIKVLADIAGGHGFLLSQILKANSDLRGILFDLDHVIAGAGTMLAEQGVAGRVQTTSGDFFKEVPPADGYIMKHIIHDWDDEQAVLIMKNINQAMTGDGKLLLVEMVVPPGNEPHPSKVLDLEMLTLPGGVERTETEFASLFERAGFKLNRVVPTPTPFSVVEAVRG